VGALLVVLASVAAPDPVGLAHDHEHPTASIALRGEVLQEGYLMQYCWVTTTSDGSGQFVSKCADKPWGFPSVDKVPPLSRVRIRITKSQKPRGVLVRSYRRLDEHGTPVRGRNLPVLLRPVMSDGQPVAWDALIDLCHADRHYYLQVAGLWTDEEGSGRDQDAVWTFHLKTRSHR